MIGKQHDRLAELNWFFRPTGLVLWLVVTLLVSALFSSNGFYRWMHGALGSPLAEHPVHAMSVTLRHSQPIGASSFFVVGDPTFISLAKGAADGVTVGHCSAPSNTLARLTVCLNRMRQLKVSQPVVLEYGAESWYSISSEQAQQISYKLDPVKPPGSFALFDRVQVRQLFLLLEASLEGVVINAVEPRAVGATDKLQDPAGWQRFKASLAGFEGRLLIVVDSEQGRSDVSRLLGEWGAETVLASDIEARLRSVGNS